MVTQFLEAGKILNTHGLRGEIKVQVWADSPDFLKGFGTVYIDAEPFPILAARVHKGNCILLLEGIDTIEKAEPLKNKILCIDRNDANLAEGQHFMADTIGLTAVDEVTGKTLGTVQEILNMPTQDLYVIRGEREILLPAVPAFIKNVDTEKGILTVHMIEGL